MSRDATNLTEAHLDKLRAAQFDVERHAARCEMLQIQARETRAAYDAARGRFEGVVKALSETYEIPEGGSVNTEDGKIVRPPGPPPKLAAVPKE